MRGELRRPGEQLEFRRVVADGFRELGILLLGQRLLLLLLVNDREIMRDLANGWRDNLAGGTIVVAISLIGALYGVITVFPALLGK